MEVKIKKVLKEQNVSTSSLSKPVKPQSNTKAVCSKIEHTAPLTNSTSTAASMVEPALAYRTRINDLGRDMFEYAVKLSGGNMLNAKLALWEAIRRVEKEMKEKGV